MTDLERLKTALDDSLGNGSYTRTFLKDLYELWQSEGISPEVVLREIRVLEGLAKPLMELESADPIPVWVDGRQTEYNRSPSATKSETQFKSKQSPLAGLWHKHYFANQEDFLKPNVANQARGRPGQLPIAMMMARLIEGKVTGEWIVFKMEGNVRTYLCLAKHSASLAGDQAIFDRIADA